MRLENMFGGQVRQAVADRWPLIIPAGTIEYHADHCSTGTDTQIVMGALDRLDRRMDVVIAPPFWYGPASYAVGGPEGGSVDVDATNFQAHVKDVLRAFLEMGWRRIAVVIHHQYEMGELLPLALAFLTPAKQLVFEWLEKHDGRGWWGNEANARFYEKLSGFESPWNWIRVMPLMSPDVQKATGYDHAGEWETSFLMAARPESVDLSRLDESAPWFARPAANASREKGERMMALVLDDLQRRINLEGS